jgi:3',5'-cyclic AMP phosphodiesterase CpdA
MPTPPPPRRRDAAALGRRLFRFALVADTHINPEDGISTSPFRTNALANDRARFVFADINRLDPPPAFVVHLGDIVHPVPELPSHEAAAGRFKAIAAQLRSPLYVLPGNHDVGDKPVEWMPAATVTQAHVESYRELHGRDYYSFDAENCRVVLVNAQIVNSGLPCEQEQEAWLEGELSALNGRRWFLCMHYPPFVTERDEANTYDNIDEPGRSWLLGLIERHRPEALFCGHVHYFWYNVIGDTEMYLLPATSFLRHDYTEFYRIGPGDEYGRNDSGKFGYFVVDVHEGGHVAHCVRTFGAILTESGHGTSAAPAALPRVHTKTSRGVSVGVDLRHPWAELVEIAATGGVQEFERKKARNDYPLLALWEMGVRHLRVPLQDFLDPSVRRRMRMLREVGHEFHAFCFGVPEGRSRDALEREPAVLESLEIVLPWSRMAAALPAIRRLRAETGLRIALSKLRKNEDAQFDASRFNHFINHGFVANESEQIAALVAADPAAEAFDALAFRVARHAAPTLALEAIAALVRGAKHGAVAHVRLAAEDPAVAMNDDIQNANRVAETVLAARAHRDVQVFFDTFVDVDRGYFPRTGFVDRRYNPRLASSVYAHLYSALGTEPIDALAVRREDGVSILRARLANLELALLLPESGKVPAARAPDVALRIESGTVVEVVDLETGRTCPLGASREPVHSPRLLRWARGRAT